MASSFLKDPSAVLDYKFDLAATTNGGTKPDWLDTTNSEVISSYAITAETGITVDSDSQTDSDTSITVWLSGGTAGTNYSVACEWTTSAGRTDERTITIVCQER